jgi:hypothetical protein
MVDPDRRAADNGKPDWPGRRADHLACQLTEADVAADRWRSVRVCSPSVAPSGFLGIIGSVVPREGCTVTSTIEREEVQVRELFERVDAVVGVAHVIENDHPGEAEKLLQVSSDALHQAAPVRVPIAARLLVVSDRTVRAWVNEGVLTSQTQHPRLLLDTERLHAVLQFVRDLRARGQDRDLLTILWQRLQDQALLDRDDLGDSLEQMRAGRATPALTLEEEQAVRR